MPTLDYLKKIALRLEGFSDSEGRQAAQVHPFDERNIHSRVSKVAKALFDDGHFSQSVFEAFKLVDKEVEATSGLKETGRSLMMNAFNEKKPVVQLTNLSSSTEINQQEGFKFIYAGSISAIRNPRGHEVGFQDSVDDCLDYLVLASILLRTLDNRVKP